MVLITRQEIKGKVLAGEGLSPEEAFGLAGWPLERLEELLSLAQEVRERFWGQEVELLLRLKPFTKNIEVVILGIRR